MSNRRKPEHHEAKSRVLVLGEIDPESVNEVIQEIIEINEEDEKKTTARKPIKLYINSPGGCIYSAFALIDIMATTVTPIHTICYGHAMSAAFLIYICGDVRISSPKATFMYHDISTEIEGDTTLIKRESEENNRLLKLMDSVILEKTQLKKTVLKKVIRERSQKYWIADEALKVGIVDQVL